MILEHIDNFPQQTKLPNSCSFFSSVQSFTNEDDAKILINHIMFSYILDWENIQDKNSLIINNNPEQLTELIRMKHL